MNSQSSHVDVVVVGAGFAGLTVARTLTKAGVSVVVLEADDRVGGRTMPGRVAEQVVDLGGQWVGPDQLHLLALAEELGVRTIPQYLEGEHILDIAGRQARHTEDQDLPLQPADLAEFDKVTAELDALTAKTDVAAPWNIEGAGALDGQTFETWLRGATESAAARSVYRQFVKTLFCVEPGQVSVLTFLQYAAGSHGVIHMMSSRGGSQDSIFEGGVWQLAGKMAQELGDAVVINAPVRSIAQTSDEVTVTSDAGVWTANLAVVTAAPPMAARISYTPALSALRDGLTQRMPMGSVIKLHVAYATPFWRAQGLSGQIISDRTVTGPWFDRSFPGVETGCLVGFFVAGPAQAWADRSPEDRRARALEDLTTYLGPEANAPIDYVERVWPAAPWQRGGYTTAAGPGVLTAFGPALRGPAGRVHWAGTETADVTPGYINGAIQSGKRAAADCIEHLKP
ncbi:flavin monoamine oxidase family protein [Catellatospora paridis]|uniref:flavin monoamine oxidase family protein n=1 Tax=Catellatospora paridis TaxID=1617086 RepID=UPI0012D39640|nr:FAD-dependent oxidoreductase [Catellatospora paridis]